MFDMFGEFDSYVEINMCAQGLKEEGDLESLRKMAAENGLSDFVEMYIEGINEELCDPILAAIGKLQVEYEDAKGWEELAKDIKDYLESNCDQEDFAMQIRKKGKSLKGVAGEVLTMAKKNAKHVALGNISCSYAGPHIIYEIIRNYYRK